MKQLFYWHLNPENQILIRKKSFIRQYLQCGRDNRKVGELKAKQEVSGLITFFNEVVRPCPGYQEGSGTSFHLNLIHVSTSDQNFMTPYCLKAEKCPITCYGPLQFFQFHLDKIHYDFFSALHSFYIYLLGS